ncbi:MAG: response regulator [Bacillota bacterium]
MIRAVIVDDERPALEKLHKMLARQEGIEVAGTFTSSRQAIPAISRIKPNVVFFDIEMPGISGLEATGQVLATDPNIDVVFVTAFNHYAVEAFELNALDYLLKPVAEERLQKTLSRIISRRGMAAVKGESGQLVRVFSLGKFELKNNNSEPVSVSWRTEKTRELFAFFLHHRNSFVSRDRIIETIWPGLETERATGRLHTSVYNLRKMLKQKAHVDALQYANNRYILKTENLYFDVEEFLQILCSRQNSKEIAVHLLERAVELYRGDYLEEEYYEWAAEERDRLLRLYLKALKQLSTSSLRCKEYEAAETYLKKWLTKEPLAEEAHCLLMETYARQGKHQQLVRQFEAYKKILLEELGLEPGKSVKTLFYKLLNESLE